MMGLRLLLQWWLLFVGAIGPAFAAFPTTPEVLGRPASVEAVVDGVRAEFVARIDPIKIIGDSVGRIKVKEGVRRGCELRVIRKYEEDPDWQVIAGFTIYDPAVNTFVGVESQGGIPWVPSIAVGEGMVWALFARDEFNFQKFKLFRARIDSPGRKPIPVDDHGTKRKKEPWVEERLNSQRLDVYLELDWQQMLFEDYMGAFRIVGCRGGVLELRCPILPDTTETRKYWRKDYVESRESHAEAQRILPREESVRLPAMKRSLLDEELVLRYEIEKKKWTMIVPEGDFPLLHEMPTDLNDRMISLEEEKGERAKKEAELRRIGAPEEMIEKIRRKPPPENRR